MKWGAPTGVAMQPGDELVVRESNERVRLVAVLDSAGTLLIEDAAGATWSLPPDEVMTLHERHGCACCAS